VSYGYRRLANDQAMASRPSHTTRLVTPTTATPLPVPSTGPVRTLCTTSTTRGGAVRISMGSHESHATANSRKQYRSACRACSVNRSKPSMTTMIERADDAVKKVNKCDGSVVGAEAFECGYFQSAPKHIAPDPPTLTSTARLVSSSSASSSSFPS
jgi:hypothetical protein